MGIFNSTVKSFSSPAKYIQGRDVFDNLGQLALQYGKNAFMIIDVFFYKGFTEALNKQYESLEGKVVTRQFGGQITVEEIEESVKEAEAANANVIIGIGGGKTLDTAKDVANKMKLPVIIMPTTASTDAPTSGLSVVYKANGEHSHIDWYKKNPELILVDSSIIANAPVRFLIAGMGDALATYFEAKAHFDSNTGHPDALNGDDLGITRAGMAIAKECYHTLMEKGEAAVVAVKEKAVTKAVEDIIECNTLLSGLGFENTGCSGAHSIANGLTAIEEGCKNLHGESVAFGTIVELIAENQSMEVIDEVLRFCVKVGLPICYEDLNIPETEENIQKVAEASMYSFWNCEPLTIDKDDVAYAIKTANALAKEYKA